MPTSDQDQTIPLDYALPRGHSQRHPSRRDAAIRLVLAGLAMITLYGVFTWVLLRLGQR